MIPLLHWGKLVIIRQVYPPAENGNFTNEHAHEPLAEWTQLQALNLKTGAVSWTTECGVNMGFLPLPQSRADGRTVAVVGRGGGHGPPETPEGISMIDLSDGSTLLTLPLEGFMSTMSFSRYDGNVIVYHRGECLKVDEVSGEILERILILDSILGRVFEGGEWADESVTISAGKSSREITQESNLLVGNYSFFPELSAEPVGASEPENESGGMSHVAGANAADDDWRR